MYVKNWAAILVCPHSCRNLIVFQEFPTICVGKFPGANCAYWNLGEPNFELCYSPDSRRVRGECASGLSRSQVSLLYIHLSLLDRSP